MKRATMLFLLIIPHAILPALGWSDTASEKPVYTDSLMVDLVPTIIAAVNGSVVLDIEAQTAIDRYWSAFFSYETGTIGGRTMFDLEMGPQVRPWGGYLTGAWVGLYPGVGSFSTLTETDWIAGLSADVGWEWIFDPGLILGLSAGASWYSGSTSLSGLLASASVHIGYGFSAPSLHGK